jgi:hypothetical protein
VGSSLQNTSDDYNVVWWERVNWTLIMFKEIRKADPRYRRGESSDWEEGDFLQWVGIAVVSRKGWDGPRYSGEKQCGGE